MSKIKKVKVFDNIYSSLSDEYDEKGNFLNTVLYDQYGNYSVIIKTVNPVLQFCTNIEKYYDFHSVYMNILQTLGEDTCLQKQDIFCKQHYHHDCDENTEFLSKAYFDYYEGRPYVEISTYLIISQETNRKYDSKKWESFHLKVQKVIEILKDQGLDFHVLNKEEIKEYVHRYVAFNFQKGPVSMTNFKCSDDYLKINGSTVVKGFSVIDVDDPAIPTQIQPYHDRIVNGFPIPVDLFAFFTECPNADCIVYNQVIMIPRQRPEVRRLMAKQKRHESMPDPSNRVAVEDIQKVTELVQRENKVLCYCNFSFFVAMDQNHVNETSSYLETRMYECGIGISKSTFNQLELFRSSFPGNSFELNPEYDRFLTLMDSAACFLFKEYVKQSETTPLKVYYTDRHGLPIAIDFTGKEGAVKYTDNSNFFCLGPSGSGKSFHMNSVVRQLIEQGTDVVMVDTGDSYEGICGYFNGTYISYSKEHPISMNPFKITLMEYEEGFKEKKNFLKSLIILIWKGSSAVMTGVEERVIDLLLEEYYQQYFHPFTKYSPEERKNIRTELMIEAKATGDYQQWREEMERTAPELLQEDIDDMIEMNAASDQKWEEPEQDEQQRKTLEDEAALEKKRAERAKAKRLISRMYAVIRDSAATEGEKMGANNQIMRLTPKVMEGNYLIKIDKQIDEMERDKRSVKVTSLSFNSFYEFAMQRIPTICRENKIEFERNVFKFVLKQFYKGGELEHTLNNDMDNSLFDERFIVFEIDKIKEDKILFPIVTLIIMDVFLQKMRLKKGRKALIIEEAWKAIASPTMAEYIKYLYKTVRKFKGIAGVVTQELNDVISSPIVKEAIISNSDIKILLDQAKFKDRYDDIAKILGLTEVERKKIFTINRLDNHEGRSYFKEVYIGRGQDGLVLGVEEPPECYMAYTTERDEKESLKIYKAFYENNTQKAITAWVRDYKKKGCKSYLEFARMVNSHNAVMERW